MAVRQEDYHLTRVIRECAKLDRRDYMLNMVGAWRECGQTGQQSPEECEASRQSASNEAM